MIMKIINKDIAMRKLLRLFSASFVCLLMTSCYTVFPGPEAKPLTIESSVVGAQVFIKGELVGHTPYTHWGKRANVKKITVKEPGYKDMTLKTKRKNKSGIYWNFFPYPLYNWIWGYFLDRSNGTGVRYTQDYYYFNLQKKN